MGLFAHQTFTTIFIPAIRFMIMTVTHKKLLFVASILLLYYPIVSMHLWNTLDPYVVHEEHRVLFAHHQINDPALFKDDYIAEYKSNAPGIWGYDALSSVMVKYTDTRVLHKRLPLLMLIVTIVAMGAAAWKLGGWFAAWATSVLVLVQPVFSYQITAPIAHMFAFPLMACFLAALVYGRVYWMAFVTVLSGLLYPVVAIFSGATLAFYLLLMPQRSRAEASAWPWLKRMLLLAVTASIVVAAALPSLDKIEGYGDYIAPFTQTDTFPEAGEGQRYFVGNSMPIAHVLWQMIATFHDSDYMAVFIAFILFGGTVMLCIHGFKIFCSDADHQEHKDRLMALLWAVFAALVVGYVLLYGYYYRLWIYSLPLIYCLLLPISLHAWLKQLPGFRWDPKLVTVIGVLAFTMQIDSTDPKEYGYHHIEPAHREVYEFVAQSDKQAMFAGWPGSRRFIEFVPYLSKRKALLTLKMHEPRYVDYTMEMRRRMVGLTHAYLATDLQPIYALRDQWHVDYLIVDMEDFEASEAPYYFKPYDEQIEALWEQGSVKGFVLPTLQDKAVFTSGSTYVINLHDL